MPLGFQPGGDKKPPQWCAAALVGYKIYGRITREEGVAPAAIADENLGVILTCDSG